VISLKHDRAFYVASEPHRCLSGSGITCDGVMDSPYLLGTYPDSMLSICIDLGGRNWYASRRLTTVKLELTVWQQEGVRYGYSSDSFITPDVCKSF
jgi:hypothetical protein